MAAGYELEIKSGKDVILLSTKADEGQSSITGVSFKMNTLNDLTRNKSDGVRAEIKIVGIIDSKNKENTRKLAKWALDFDSNTMYRNVTLTITDNSNDSGSTLRKYELDEMFVIDYEEKTGIITKDDASDKSEYVLWIAQKDGKNKREVFSN